MARPFRAGQLVGQAGKLRNDVFDADYSKGGFGVPEGNPMRPQPMYLPPNEWSQREPFDRPTAVIPDTDFQGVIYYLFCGPQPDNNAYCAWANQSTYIAESHRRGMPIFINRPGEYSFYLAITPGAPLVTVKCRKLDAAFMHVDKPGLKFQTGYDPELPGCRAQGATPDDPAGMWIANHGGATLFAGAPRHSVLAVSAASQLALAANPLRKGALFVNDHATIIHYLHLGGPAVANTGIRVNAVGGAYQIDGDQPFIGEVYAIGSAAGPSNLLVTEW